MLELIRWKNIIIIWLTIWIISWAILPISKFISVTYTLLGLSIFISGFAAFGYLLNDYFDKEIDLINRPNRRSHQYTSKTLIAFAFVFWTISCAMLPLFLNFSMQVYTVIAATCTIQLWAYSRYFKCTPFLGNIFVSIFCAGVPFTLLFIYDNEIFRLWVWAYALFALLTTLIREIVKDIEDVDGDRSQECKTLPVAYGFNKTKMVMVIITALLNISVLIGLIFLPLSSMRLILYVLLIIAPSVGIYYLIIRSKSAESYSSISQYLKGYMVIGLLFLILIKWIA